jgi:hypothetical protein
VDKDFGAVGHRQTVHPKFYGGGRNHE